MFYDKRLSFSLYKLNNAKKKKTKRYQVTTRVVKLYEFRRTIIFT